MRVRTTRLDMFRRRFRTLSACAAAALGAAMLLSGPAQAQTKASFPEKPVRIVIPFGPGGVGDLTMRLLAHQLTELTKQQFFIDNRPGAGGRVAMRAVLDSPADGYTLGVTGNGQAISMTLFKERPYDVLKDFTQVSIVATFEILVAVRQDSPLKSLQDIVNAARKNPGKMNFGTILPGSTQNLSAHLLMQTEDIKATLVPYKTTPALVQAIMRGDVDVGFDFYAGFVGPIKEKQVRIVATGGETRNEWLKDVPTAKESGFPNYVVTSWNALAGPAGMPDDVLKTLNAQINKALSDPGVRAKASNIGLTAAGSTPAEMTERMANDIKRWGAVIEKAGIPKQ